MIWLPIDTLQPNEGDTVLGYCTYAHWDVGEDCSSPRRYDSPFIAEVVYDATLKSWWVSQCFTYAIKVTVTHWMPLPEGPK